MKFNTTQVVWELRFDIWAVTALTLMINDHWIAGSCCLVAAFMAAIGSFMARDKSSTASG